MGPLNMHVSADEWRLGGKGRRKGYYLQFARGDRYRELRRLVQGRTASRAKM